MARLREQFRRRALANPVLSATKPFAYQKSGCFDIGNMLNKWLHAFPTLPIFFTEVNWDGKSAGGSDGKGTGTYLVDLFTRLSDHDAQYRTNTPGKSPLRVAWFDGADFLATVGQGTVGIYGPFAQGGEKIVTISPGAETILVSGKPKKVPYCILAGVRGKQHVSADYKSLIKNPCY
ncbi:MAG: hypothetical protein JWO59_2204 [Chloroflexi bacterium]|nr:hypothetical protein [Chloroflexota bacterium]